jgi:type IV pilus assembly protein PilM
VLRALGSHSLDDDQSEVLVDIGARVTNVVVHTAGVPHFVRILLMGGADLTDAIAERAGVSLAEAEGFKQVFGLEGGPSANPLAVRALDGATQTLVDEIRGSLDYFRSTSVGNQPHRLVLSGGGATLRGFSARLEQGVRIPVEMGNPVQTMRLGRTGLDDAQLELVRPLAAVPVGLAMGAVR